MNLYKTIIIDDEPLAIDVIAHHLKRFPNFEVIRTFADPIDAFKFLKEGHQVNVVFTDIAMPGISGIELAKISVADTKFMMTTSFSEYSVESFDLVVFDYLLKSVSFERFCKAISRFESMFRTDNQSMCEPSFFVKGHKFIKILVKDVDYIEGLKDYVKIITGKNHSLALKSREETLSTYQFMRIHKSHIIPLNKISQYNGKCVIINNSEIPVANSHRETLKVYLNKNKL